MEIIDLDNFFEGLAQVEAAANLDNNTSASESGGGGSNRSSFGTRLWHGFVNLPTSYHDRADEITAKLHYLQEADVYFRVAPSWKLSKPPTAGSVTGIEPDRRKVRLSQSAADGEMFSITFQGNRQSMHQVAFVDDGVHKVTPALPFGVQVGDAVTFGRPEIVAFVTNVDFPKFRAGVATAASFEWRQEL